MGVHAHARHLFDEGWSRAYRLGRCEGFHREVPTDNIAEIDPRDLRIALRREKEES